MSRPRSKAPAMVCHASGQARVTLDYRDFYLGKYGSKEAIRRYYALLATYNANDQRMPEDVPTHQIDEVTRIRDIVADYRQRELPGHEGSAGTYSRQKAMLALLEKLYGSEPADTFGPMKLESLRDQLVKTGNSRAYINDQIREVVIIFRYGVRREMVPPSVITAIKTVPPLRRGEAAEPIKRQPVDLDTVVAAMKEMPRSLADCIQLQLSTACRPSETWKLRSALIDRSGPEWIYRPDQHKTAHHGKQRAIPVVGIAREVLEPYLFSDGPCFINAKGNPWNKDSYYAAVQRACDRAGVKRFAPYDLRHLSAQRVRDALGVEHVQAILGHSRIATAEIYSQASEKRAIEAARIVS